MSQAHERVARAPPAWVAQQITEANPQARRRDAPVGHPDGHRPAGAAGDLAFPFDEAPQYLIRDRDSIYGEVFRQRVANMGIKEVLIAPRSPWQNPFVERLIGSIRRECLDHVIVLNEAHLRRILVDYFAYYNQARCHMSLDGDSPVGREVEPPERGKVVVEPIVGGLHLCYRRCA